MHWFTLHRAGVVCAMALFCVGVVRADMVPSLTWTGDATTVSLMFAGTAEAVSGTATNGIDTNAYAFDTAVSFTVDRTFAVTSPGDFILTTFVSAYGGSENCGLSCSDVAVVTAQLDGETSILGVFSQPFPDSPSSSTVCGSPAPGCFTILNFTGSQSDTVYLGLGDYTLEQNYLLSIHGSGYPFVQPMDIDSSLVPTPEPRAEIAILAVGLLMVLVLWRRKTQTV